MVLIKIILVGAALAAALILLKQEHVFQRAGVVGGCSEVAAPLGSTESREGQWWSCHEGLMTGYPSLLRDSCDSQGIVGARETWYCPAPINSAPGY